MNRTFGLKRSTPGQGLFLLAFVSCYTALTMILYWLSFMGAPDIDRGEAPADEQLWGKVYTVFFDLVGFPFFSPLMGSTHYAWGQRLLWGGHWWQQSLFWSVLLINSTFWGLGLTVWWAKRRSSQKARGGSGSA